VHSIAGTNLPQAPPITHFFSRCSIFAFTLHSQSNLRISEAIEGLHPSSRSATLHAFGPPDGTNLVSAKADVTGGG
jgi:hypothetical protein